MSWGELLGLGAAFIVVTGLALVLAGAWSMSTAVEDDDEL